jgi:hypothetical protein
MSCNLLNFSSLQDIHSTGSGNRTRTNITAHRIFVPSTVFTAPESLRDLWSGLSLHPILVKNQNLDAACQVSTPFPKNWNLARDYH